MTPTSGSTVIDTPLHFPWKMERTCTFVAYLYPVYWVFSWITLVTSYETVMSHDELDLTCLSVLKLYAMINCVLERFVKSGRNCLKLTESWSVLPFCSIKSSCVSSLRVTILPIMENLLTSSAYSWKKLYILKMIVLMLCLCQFWNTSLFTEMVTYCERVTSLNAILIST